MEENASVSVGRGKLECVLHQFALRFSFAEIDHFDHIEPEHNVGIVEHP